MKSIIVNIFCWLWQEVQEVTLSVCLSVCDICEFFTLSKQKILCLVFPVSPKNPFVTLLILKCTQSNTHTHYAAFKNLCHCTGWGVFNYKNQSHCLGLGYWGSWWQGMTYSLTDTRTQPFIVKDSDPSFVTCIVTFRHLLTWPPPWPGTWGRWPWPQPALGSAAAMRQWSDVEYVFCVTSSRSLSYCDSLSCRRTGVQAGLGPSAGSWTCGWAKRWGGRPRAEAASSDFGSSDHWTWRTGEFCPRPQSPRSDPRLNFNFKQISSSLSVVNSCSWIKVKWVDIFAL